MRPLLKAAIVGLGGSAAIALGETLCAYPGPSSPAAAFFLWAFLTYAPAFVIGALFLAHVSPRHGLSLGLPLAAGLARLIRPVLAEEQTSVAAAVTLAGLAIAGVGWWLRRSDHRQDDGTLWLGLLLPVFAAKAGRLATTARGLPTDRVDGIGVLLGLAVFIFVGRSFSARPTLARAIPLGLLVAAGMAWWQGNQAPLLAGTAAEPKASSQRDIVLVVLDTVRADALDFADGGGPAMPRLQEFAKSATRFRRVWANGTWTLPSHASLFSGRRLSRHLYDSGFPPEGRARPREFLAERLRQAGYMTSAVAANFGVLGRGEPLLAGFERVEVEPLRPPAFRPWFFDLILQFPRAPFLWAQVARFPGPYVRAPRVVEKSLEFWNRSDARPKFLFINFMEAHLPWIPEPRDLGRFGPVGATTEREQVAILGRYLADGRPNAEEIRQLRARYRESLSTLDRHLGSLLDGIGPQAIVIITSDHGESLGEHDRFGHRNSVDEAATRIPLVIRSPEMSPGVREDTLVQLTDLFGFISRTAGLDVRGETDATPFGERARALIEHRPGPQGRLPSSYPRGDLTALIEWPYKLVQGSSSPERLFNIETDPGERRNIAGEFPEIAARLRGAVRDTSGRPSVPGVPDAELLEKLRGLGYVK